MDKALGQIISKMPTETAVQFAEIESRNLQEIRFRIGRPTILYYADRVEFLGRNSNHKDIENLITAFCRNSVYAYCANIKEGFLTIPGGHRVGIVGRAVYKEDKLSNITSFSGINIRIAREIRGCAEPYINYISNSGRIFNTLIISAPNGGKTTLLRDIARILGKHHKVTIIDERSEIAAVDFGTPQFDIGVQTDVLDGFLKSDGIRHALRSLSPDVIITDEIGTTEDLYAIQNILKGGCKIITSIHGESFDEIKEKKSELLSLFDMAVVLEKREVKECIKL